MEIAKYRSLLIGVVFIIVLSGSTIAYTFECALDIQCSPATTDEFCYEDGSGAICTNISANPYEACITNTCTDSTDCIGLGKEYCHPYYDVCMADSQIGEPCSLDGDCPSGVYCKLNICTPSSATCNGDGDCPSGTTCLQKVCRSKGTIGAECYKSTDCLSGICDSVNLVCSECDTSDGINGDETMPEGYFCDIEHNDSCQTDSLYPTYSLINDLKSPILDLLRVKYDTCWDDGCCATNNCVNGYCVGAGLGGDSGVDFNYFCSDYGYDLISNWFDNMPLVTDPPNNTFFEDFFNKSDLYIIKHDNIAGYTSANSAFNRSSDWSMNVIFYENSTGDVCYFEQKQTEVYWHCVENCVDAGVAILIASDTAYVNDSTITGNTEWSCSDTNLAFVKTGQFYYPPISPTVDAWMIGVVKKLSPYKTSMIANTYRDLSSGSYGVCGLAYYDGAYWRLEDRYDTNPAVGKDWYERTGSTFNYPPATLVMGACGIGFSYTSESTSFSVSSIEWEGFTDLACCVSNEDCPEDFSCSNGICYYDPLGSTVLTLDVYSNSLKLQSPDPNICTDEDINFYVELLSSTGSSILPSGTITANVSSGTGTITPASCDSTDAPCIFTYTAPAGDSTEYINFYYSGNDVYGDTNYKIKLDVSTDCNYLVIGVFDSISGIPLKSVKAETGSGGIKYSNADGLVSFFDLPSSSLNITFSKSGYQTATWLFLISDLNNLQQIDLVPNEANNPNTVYDYSFDPPTSSSEAINSIKLLIFGAIASPLQIGMSVFIFLFGIGLIIILVKSVL